MSRTMPAIDMLPGPITSWGERTVSAPACGRGVTVVVLDAADKPIMSAFSRPARSAWPG